MDTNPIVLDDTAGDVIVVVVEGEHDIYTAPTLRERLDEALGRAGGIVVDLTAATFVDSSLLGGRLRWFGSKPLAEAGARSGELADRQLPRAVAARPELFALICGANYVV